MSSDEQSKCMSMANALKDASLYPGIDCVQKDGASGCVQALKSKEADAFTADGGHIYENRQSVKPIMAEDYGFGI